MGIARRKAVRERCCARTFGQIAFVVVALALSVACEDRSAGPADASIELELCARVNGCGLLARDAGALECGVVLERCTGELDRAAHAAWSEAVEPCLRHEDCGALEQCYLAVPGC